MDKHDLIGLEVANDGQGLKKALEAHYKIASLKHIGNFVFRAELEDGNALLIRTVSVDLGLTKLRITGIRTTKGGDQV